jgi:hypothetical protein
MTIIKQLNYIPPTAPSQKFFNKNFFSSRSGSLFLTVTCAVTSVKLCDCCLCVWTFREGFSQNSSLLELDQKGLIWQSVGPSREIAAEWTTKPSQVKPQNSRPPNSSPFPSVSPPLSLLASLYIDTAASELQVLVLTVHSAKVLFLPVLAWFLMCLFSRKPLLFCTPFPV